MRPHAIETREVRPRLLDAFVTLVCLAGMLLFLTSGLLFVQAGWIHPHSMKSFSRVMSRIAVLAPAAALLGIRVFFPSSFGSLAIVRFWDRLRGLPLGFVTAGLFSAYFLIMTAVGFVRHAALETRAFDLGIFAQPVWATLHGSFLYSSLKGGICLLGDHVSPILAAVTPFYALWQDPRMLLVLQAAAAAACLFPLAALSEKVIGRRGVTLVFLLHYFIYLPMRSALHEDFHPELLIEPFLFLAFMYIEEEKLLPAFLSLIVIMASKESMNGVAFALGAYALVFKRRYGFGTAVMLLSFSIFMFEVKWLVPRLTGMPYFYGANFGDVLRNPFTGILSKVFSKDGLSYVISFFLPFLFLPFLHVRTLLLTFPILFQNVLSSNPLTRSLSFHYTTGLSAFAYIASIYGFKEIERKAGKFVPAPLLASIFMLAALLVSAPYEYYFLSGSMSNLTPHRKMVREYLRKIPEDYTVATHNNLIAQIPNRFGVYQFDYTSKVSKTRLAAENHVDLVILDEAFWEPGLPGPGETVKELTAAGYSVLYENDGLHILGTRSFPGAEKQ